MRRSPRFLLLVFAVFLAPQFVFAQMPNRQPGSNPNGLPSAQPSEPESPQPSPTPEHSRVVYITDFELNSVAQSADSNHAASSAPQASDTPPPAGNSPQTNASAIQAQHIVKLMSDELAKDFKKSGYTAKFLRPSDARPDDGFLITGIFAQVGPDNRLHRAMLGSGQGAEAMQLYVAVQDFTRFTPPLYQPEPTDDGATQASPAIVLNPNADAARFSIETDITDKAIKQIAQKIIAELVKSINAQAKSGYQPLNKYAKP
ncbi:MAG: DUF4410 domain-containing protein [Candidatus Acidiferrales bacterium]